MSIGLDQVIDKYVDTYGEKAGIEVLSVVAEAANGGQGYNLSTAAMIDFDGYDVLHGSKQIRIDSTNFGFSRSAAGMADDLEEAMNVEFRKSHSSLLGRVAWGSGKVLLGVIETGIGVIGIVVPEPGTTAGGVVLTTLGVNSIGDGLTQLAGGNNGHGYNILGEGAAKLGESASEMMGYDPNIGRAYGEGAFLIGSVILGSWGSVRILHVPGKTFLRASSAHPVQVGRTQLLYSSKNAQDGMTIININNNAGQSVLRFVTHSGVLNANGRIGLVMDGSKIVQGKRVLKHTPTGKEMVKGLLKLAAHGFMKGL